MPLFARAALTVVKNHATALRGTAVRNVALAVITGTLITGPAVTPAQAAPPSDYRVKGVDTSHYNHPGNKVIDWQRVRRAGYAFMYAKATEGTTHQDRWLAADLKNAKAASLFRGAYHFYGTTVSRTRPRTSSRRCGGPTTRGRRPANCRPPSIWS